MKTRKEYLNNECTHSEYYGQFVTNSIKSLVKQQFGIQVLRDSYASDEHLNNIPLVKWDVIAPLVTSGGKMKDCGDYLTLSGQVCILKEAARQLIEESIQ